MSGTEQRLAGITSQLRAAFDASFALADADTTEKTRDFLAIRVADHAYAVSLGEVESLHADRRLVPAPSSRAALLGLVGVRGSVVPAYDLRQLLGYAKGPTARWLLLARASAPFGLVFDEFEGHLRVAEHALLPAVSGPGASGPVLEGSVTSASGLRPLLSLRRLFAEVMTGLGRADAPERREEVR